MKDRLSILFLSALLLVAVGYVQIFHKILNDNRYLIEVSSEANDGAEEEAEKSSEENSRQTDEDEDTFNLGEQLNLFNHHHLFNFTYENYSFGLLGFYPEIVSPPPQGWIVIKRTAW